MKRRKEEIPLWQSKGYLPAERVNLPPGERMLEGPVAVIECPQRIPCDPCEESCPVGAIHMEDINGVPTVDTEKCTGCSICVENCPGLAIFTLDCSMEGGCEVTLPYEFKLPEIGEEVSALNRKGEEVTKARVKKIKTKENSSGDTSTVTIEIPEEYVKEVRNIRRMK